MQSTLQLYKIGDVCIGRRFTRDVEMMYNGMECTITGDLVKRTTTAWRTNNLIELESYSVTWANGDANCVTERCLKLKRPPEELSSWERITEISGYNPTVAPKIPETAE